MTFWTETRPRARKAHTCSLCRRTIDPGEVYRRGVGLDDGTAWTFVECAHCAVLALVAAEWWDDEGYGPDLFHEWEPATLAHLRLKVLALRGWRRPDGTLYPVPDRESRS